MKSIVILISGRGSNMEAIVRAGIPGARIAAVISNRPGAGGLEFARTHGLATAVVDHKSHPDRASFDEALAVCIDAHAPDLVVLAGFMRVLGPEFVRHYRGRLINIHPALLPAFPGLDTHRRAIEAGAAEHGASVHFVTEEVDAGPVIHQARVPVLPGDTPEALAARVLEQEHRLYPEVIGWIAEGRVRLEGDRVVREKRAAG